MYPMVSHRGKPFPTVANRFPPWQTVSHRGKPWETVGANRFPPWQTVSHRGKPWETVGATVRHRGIVSPTVACIHPQRRPKLSVSAPSALLSACMIKHFAAFGLRFPYVLLSVSAPSAPLSHILLTVWGRSALFSIRIIERSGASGAVSTSLFNVSAPFSIHTIGRFGGFGVVFYMPYSTFWYAPFSKRVI